MSEDKNLVLKPIESPLPLEKPQFLKELSSNIAAMNQLITDCKMLTSNVSEYEKSLMYGHLLVEIKEQISGKAFEIIKKLIGFSFGKLLLAEVIEYFLKIGRFYLLPTGVSALRAVVGECRRRRFTIFMM